MPPTAHAGTPPAALPFTALPANLPLDGSASTPGDGASSIVAWEWNVKSKPTGSAATVTDGSTPNPVLSGRDKPGTYIVWLRTQNNLGQWSSGATDADFHAAWVAMPDSILIIEVTMQHSGLKIPGDGEHEYFEKYEALYLEVDRLRGQVNLITGTGELVADLFVDNVYEATEGHGVHFHHEVELEPGVHLYFRNQTEAVSELGHIIGGVDGSEGLRFFADRGIRFGTDQGGLSFVSGENKSASMDFNLTLPSPRWMRVGLVEASDENGNVLVRGRGSHTADLRLDIIGEDTADAGVAVDGVLLKDGIPYTLVGGAGVANRVEPVSVITAEWDGASTAPFTSLVLMGTITFQSSTFAKNGVVRGQVAFRTAVNANDKRIVVEVEGVDVFDQTFSNSGAIFIIDFVIVRTGTNTQSMYTWANGPAAVLPYETPLTLTETGLNRLYFRGQTPDLAGDLSLLYYVGTGNFKA
jgi:hypothetical protein